VPEVNEPRGKSCGDAANHPPRPAAPVATRCIESGVDIPTVSRWLGHKDGGALAMRVYSHLRDSHSVNMAQKVTFHEQN